MVEAGTVQMLLGRAGFTRVARTKMASAATVAVSLITPSLFQPRPNWVRSTLVSPEIRIEPSSELGDRDGQRQRGGDCP